MADDREDFVTLARLRRPARGLASAGLALALAAALAGAVSSASGAAPHHAKAKKPAARLAPRPPSYLYRPPHAVSRTPSVRIENPALPNRNPCIRANCASPYSKSSANGMFRGLGPNPIGNPGLTDAWRPFPPAGPGAFPTPRVGPAPVGTIGPR